IPIWLPWLAWITHWADRRAPSWRRRRTARRSRSREPRSCPHPVGSRTTIRSRDLQPDTAIDFARRGFWTMNAWHRFRAVCLFSWPVLKAFVTGPWKLLKALLSGGRRLLLSARAWVLVILLVLAALVAYSVASDRHTPFTTDAYVQAYVVQVA